MTAAAELSPGGRSEWSRPAQHQAPSHRRLGCIISDIRVSLGRNKGLLNQIAETTKNVRADKLRISCWARAHPAHGVAGSRQARSRREAAAVFGAETGEASVLRRRD